MPTVAIMFGIVPAASTVVVGAAIDMVTEETVIAAAADLVESSIEVAVTVTVSSLDGGVVGAL